ncbi:MAG: SurA N-terminal domain-containing protein, partial [Pseudomonadota bacterium]|nr:SurA N-terminal domain-containing protein [Pseudomonadota bacterium]
MLSAIREKATGWIAWILVILISIPFALWGVNSYFEGATQIVIAVANGVEIEQSDYHRALAQKQRQLVQLAGRDLGTEYLDSPVFKRQVVDSMIDEALER